MHNLVLALFVPLSAAWIVALAYLMWSLPRLSSLRRYTVPDPDRWPRLSVIIPACNEAAHLGSALATLLAQDYPDFEIIVIDDRSTDKTGDLIDRLARDDPRIRPLHIKKLPDGWLGKVHALQRGAEKAGGEWLLCTDADVHFSPGMLRRAIAFAVHRRVDHLALIPRTIQHGFWLEVAVRAFALLFFLTTGAASVNRPEGKTFVGIGAFNLVNMKTFRRTPGFEWLRLEPGDDVGLGMMMKQAGAKAYLALAFDDLAVQWYPSVAAMFKGLEKNLFGPGSNYRWWLLLCQVALIWAFVAAPWISLAYGLIQGSILIASAGAAAVAIHLLFSLVNANRQDTDLKSSLMFPFGMLLIGAMMLRAGYQCLKNDGIDWRGTHYPLDQLRAGQRVKFLKL